MEGLTTLFTVGSAVPWGSGIACSYIAVIIVCYSIIYYKLMEPAQAQRQVGCRLYQSGEIFTSAIVLKGGVSWAMSHSEDVYTQYDS